jgi:XTP/dITP diphosphohydrolase
MKLLLATYNQGKVAEIQALLAGLALDLVLPASLGLTLEVIEDGKSYQENALLKALAFAQASGLASLADDSGLEVDALGGKPGLHSARFSSLPGANDRDRRSVLLEKLSGKPRPWTARFRCVVVLANPSGERWVTEGTCPGEVIPEERGQNGFGYDPIFWIPAVQKTMAELSMPEKNQLSHRAMAVRAASLIIQSWL